MMRALAVTALLAAPAAAQETFAPPAGCGAFLTEQAANCVVTHYYTCAGDPEGFVRATTMDGDGPIARVVVDREYQWIERESLRWDLWLTLREPPADAQSLDALLASGRDDYDFGQNYGGTSELALRTLGFDVLTGERVAIDGHELERTRFASRTEDPDGTLLEDQEGAQYVSRRWRLFFGGRERDLLTGESWDRSPIEFAEPGEEGFLAARPRYGCEGLLSSREGVEGHGAG